MKQIFDWMRRQPLNAFKVYDGSIGVEPSEVNRLIDEAEAKWEAEVCEWKTVGYRKEYVEAHEFWLDKMQAECFKICPYCGKPIKILEVE